MDNYTISLYDSETGLILKKSIIGDKTYVEAEPKREFHIRLTINDAAVHKKKNPLVRPSSATISPLFFSPFNENQSLRFYRHPLTF